MEHLSACTYVKIVKNCCELKYIIAISKNPENPSRI